jgi:hypothetical protein
MKLFIKKLSTYFNPCWKNISFIPAYNCIEWQRTRDVRFLVKNIDYENMPPMFINQKNKLISAGNGLDLQCTQYEINSTKRNENIFILMKKIEAKRFDFNYIINICKYMMIAGKDEDFIKELTKSGYIIDNSKSFIDELQNVLKRNENKLIGIASDEAELKVLTKCVGGNNYDVEDLLSDLEKFHKKDFIDLKKITMLRYLSLKNQMNTFIEKSKQKKVSHGK